MARAGLKLLQVFCTFVALVTWILDIAAAIGPWLQYSSNFAGTTRYFYFGLLTYQADCADADYFEYSASSFCASNSYSSSTPFLASDSTILPAFRAAAACLILGFAGGMVLFVMLLAALFGAYGLPFKVSAVTIAAWSFVWSLLGCIIGGVKTHVLDGNIKSDFTSNGKASPGLGISIIAVVSSFALCLLLQCAVPLQPQPAASAAATAPPQKVAGAAPAVDAAPQSAADYASKV